MAWQDTLGRSVLNRIRVRIETVEQQRTWVVGNLTRRLKRLATELRKCTLTKGEHAALVAVIDQLRQEIDQLKEKE